MRSALSQRAVCLFSGSFLPAAPSPTASVLGRQATYSYVPICLKATPKGRSCRACAIRRTNDPSVTDPRSGLPPAAWRTRPHRACTAPGTRIFRQDTRIRHHACPLCLGDRVLPAVLHPHVRRAHGVLARRKSRPEASIRFVAAVLADVGRTHMALCRPCLRFGSGRG